MRGLGLVSRGTALAVGLGFLVWAGAASAQTQTAPAQSPKPPADAQKPADTRMPADAQKPADRDKPAAKDSSARDAKMSKSVTGTVKKVASDALVVEELKSDGTKGKEWAFAVDPATKTRIAKGGEQLAAADLKAGDRVAVTYSDRSGKVVAESITRLDGAAPRQ